MSPKDLKIVFLGTPDFAVASVDALVKAGFNIVAVVTAPDKPAGRGMHVQHSAVKTFAMEQGIPVLQPLKLKAPDFLSELQSYGADMQVVVAFRMLPEAVWNMPPMGTVNVHASLLPQYRGAAPINWAIINGEIETGVTTFKLKHEIDTGDILMQERVEIHPEDNAGTLHDKLMTIGASLLVKTVAGIAGGTITEKPQSSVAVEKLKHAPKIFKEDTRIEWNRNALEIHNLIRGLSFYPAAYTMVGGKQVKIYASHIGDAHTDRAGEYETDHKTYLRFAARDNWVYIDVLQQEGKKKMDIEAFLRGFRS